MPILGTRGSPDPPFAFGSLGSGKPRVPADPHGSL